MKVRRNDGESIESLLRRFKKVSKEALRAYVERHAFAISRGQRRRLKRNRARKRVGGVR